MKISLLFVSLICLLPAFAQSQYGMYGEVPPCNCGEGQAIVQPKQRREQQSTRQVVVVQQVPAIDANEAQRAMALKIVKVAGREADPRAARESLNPTNDLGYSILVVEASLDADGSVIGVNVIRRPSKPEAQDTVDLAVSAIYKAAPYRGVTRGVSGLKIMQTFAFSKDRKFYINALMN